MSIRTFADQTTADIFSHHVTPAARLVPVAVWRDAQRRLDALHAASRLADLDLPGFGVERMKPLRLGYFSIRINAHYRLLFATNTTMPTTSKSRRAMSDKRRRVLVPSLSLMRRPPVHPGAIFEEDYRKPSGLSQAEAARRMGMSTNRLNEIVNAKRGVTAETALLLQEVTGTSAEFWLSLQARHDLWHAIQAARRSGRIGRVAPILARR